MQAEQIPQFDFNAWITANQPAIARCAQNVLAAMKKDTSLRVPQTEEERRNGFEEWLAKNRAKLPDALKQEFQRAFPGIVSHLPQDYFDTLVEEKLWPQIKSFYQTYAVIYHASKHIRKYLGNATTLKQPTFDGVHWHVPLGVAGYEGTFGEVVLDADGNVIEECTSTRQDFMRNLHDQSSHPAKAANA